ncbi:MAG TPA: right-handed parallel beta-helix repeat-containing protein [Bryobacteraceae bacterium]|nr:right-handed parallel beta-helix repeat-containing protein [Bryobacteraceae bacterium]
MKQHHSAGTRFCAILAIIAAAFILVSPVAAQTTVDFAGTGDGITDNQAAFASAAATLNSAGGGTLRIHAGTYAHSGAVTFGSATNVICDRGAVLKATTDASAAMIFTGANSGIQGCRFISGAAAQVLANNAAAVFFSDCQFCYGLGNSIQGAAGDGYVVSGAGSQQVEISGGFVNGVKGYGVYVASGASSVTVDGLQIAGVGMDCIAAISVTADGTQVHDVTLSRNQCQSAAQNGIQIAGVLRGSVSGNTITGPGFHGIIVRNFTPDEAFVPDSIDVRGNAITNQSNTSYYSIGLEATQNTTASENTIRNSSGIHQWGQSLNLAIARNKLSNIAGDAINLYLTLDHFSVLENSISSVTDSCVKAVSVSHGIIAGNACMDFRTSGDTTWGAIHVENSQAICPVDAASTPVILSTSGSNASGGNLLAYPGSFDPAVVRMVNSNTSGSNFCMTF